jgi:hypothetical protein
VPFDAGVDEVLVTGPNADNLAQQVSEWSVEAVGDD